MNNFIVDWLVWHFWEMPKFLVKVWRNYIMFATNYFSLPLLLRTLFSPWRRNEWRLPKTFNLQEYTNVFVSNIFSRIMGFIMRLALIIVGSIFQVIVFIAGLIIVIFWIFIPFIIIIGIFYF